MLSHLHLLDHLSQRRAIAGPVFTADPDLLGVLPHELFVSYSEASPRLGRFGPDNPLPETAAVRRKAFVWWTIVAPHGSKTAAANSL